VGNHLGTGKAGGESEVGEAQVNQLGDKEEQAAELSREGTRSQGEAADIGDRLDGGARAIRAFFVEATRQRGETFGLEDFADGGGAQGKVGGFERVADLINGVIAFAKLDDARASGLFAGLGARAAGRRDEEGGRVVATEVMAEDLEGAGRVAKVASDVGGGTLLDKEGAKGLILALASGSGLEEKGLAIA
jgi:hypothetical protein